MKLMIIGAACLAALAVSACASTGSNAGMTPDQVHQILKDAHDAGCGGRVDIDAGAATGQVGGEAHIQFGLHGDCPSAAIPASPATPAPATPAPAK